METKKLYVLEVGEYETSLIAGVFDTLEKAQKMILKYNSKTLSEKERIFSMEYMWYHIIEVNVNREAFTKKREHYYWNLRQRKIVESGEII